jgi:hypothetical protein
MLETKYKNARAKYKKYIGPISENIKNINWPVVYISGAIQCGAEMLLLAASLNLWMFCESTGVAVMSLVTGFFMGIDCTEALHQQLRK